MRVICIEPRANTEGWYDPIGIRTNGPKFNEICTVTGEIFEGWLFAEYPEAKQGFHKQYFRELNDIELSEMTVDELLKEEVCA